MKVSGSSSIKGKLKSGKTGGASGGGAAFAGMISSGSGGEADEVESTQTIANISAVSVINEVDNVDPEEQKRQAVQHGHDILDDLEELRNSILMGTLSEQALENAYKKAVANREKTNDPHLEEVIDEIEVRAAVELAKLGRL